MAQVMYHDSWLNFCYHLLGYACHAYKHATVFCFIEHSVLRLSISNAAFTVVKVNNLLQARFLCTLASEEYHILVLPRTQLLY